MKLKFVIFCLLFIISSSLLFGQEKDNIYAYYDENNNAYIITKNIKSKILQYEPMPVGAGGSADSSFGDPFELSISDQDYFKIIKNINQLINKKSLQKFTKEDWLRSRIEIKNNGKVAKEVYLRTETKEVNQFEELLRIIINRYKK